MPRGLARHETIMVESCAEGAHSTELQGDEERLRQLGYKQELRRELSLLKNFAVSFGMLSMLTGLGGYYGFGFAYGGPMVVIWGWVLIVGMTFTVALSMAEICSSLPTTGGVYYWAGALSGKWGPMWAWISAWMSLLGQVGITAGVEYTAVNYLEGMIQVKYPGFFFDKGNGEFWAVYCVFTIFHGILNAISVRVLGWLSISSVYWHVVGTIAIVIGLPCLAPTRQKVSWVFGEFIPPNPNAADYVPPPALDAFCTDNPDDARCLPGVGISSDFYIFVIGLLLSQWAMVGYDTSAHIADETKNAAVAGPVGLLMAIGASFVCGWSFQIALTFSIQDVADAYAGSFAIVRGVFQARYGSPDGALGFMFVMFIAANYCGTFCVTSNSRMLYAFARDVPALGWFKRVNPVTGTPINSIAVMVAAACALGVTMLGSVVAFNAIASIGIIGLIVSYIIPIFLRLTVARRWFKRGPFHLGAFSHVVGWVAVVWGLFISAALILPTAYPVTKENLNYSSVAIGGTLLLCVLTWGLTARTWFKGPARNIDTGTKTEVLADAYMHGKLDEMDALADVSGTNGATKGDQFSAQ